MFDSAQRRQSRLENLEGIQLTRRSYNIAIGLFLLVAFVVNAITASLLKGYVNSLNPFILLIGYFVLSLISSIMLVKTKSVAVASTAFLVLSFATGLMLTFLIQLYTTSTVMYAFIGTAVILVVMIVMSSINPDFFLSMGRALTVSLIVAIVADLILSIFFRSYTSIIDYAVVLIFTGFIGFDWARAQAYPKNLLNAVGAAADIYLDLINIFIRLLRIFGKKD